MFSTIQHLPLYRNESFLKQKYAVEGLSIAQIATQIVSSKEAVRNGLVRAGIPIREPHHSHGYPSQPRFGTRKSSRGIAPSKVEEKVIRAISEMTDRNMGLRQIARVLSQMGIPTKCRGEKWHPQMVKRVLDYAKDKRRKDLRTSNANAACIGGV